MDKLEKKDICTIPKEFLKTKQVETFVKQGVIEVLNYLVCPNCWEDYLEEIGCISCGYWVLNNASKLPEIKRIIEKDKPKEKTKKITQSKKLAVESLSKGTIFKVINIEIDQWKIKSIKFNKDKKNYIIYISDYLLDSKQIEDRHGENYDLKKISTITYDKENTSQIIWKNALRFYSMRYFTWLWWYLELNKFVRKVLENYHGI